MKIYLVRYVVKDGGYSPGDQVSSGGYYDTHQSMVVTATNATKAKQAVERYAELTTRRVVVRKPTLLGDA
jgi:hypothetical protein